MLEAEIKERRVIEATLEGLRSLGVRIALDDFGAGYSSLSCLDRHQLGAIKIDRSFVNRINTNDRTKAIVEAILRLSGSLRLETVAEGVEDAEQLATLRTIGCQMGQGFPLGRPLSSADLEAQILDRM